MGQDAAFGIGATCGRSPESLRPVRAVRHLMGVDRAGSRGLGSLGFELPLIANFGITTVIAAGSGRAGTVAAMPAALAAVGRG